MRSVDWTCPPQQVGGPSRLPNGGAAHADLLLQLGEQGRGPPRLWEGGRGCLCLSAASWGHSAGAPAFLCATGPIPGAPDWLGQLSSCCPAAGLREDQLRPQACTALVLPTWSPVFSGWGAGKPRGRGSYSLDSGWYLLGGSELRGVAYKKDPSFLWALKGKIGSPQVARPQSLE